MLIKSSGLSGIGKVREENQDNFFIDDSLGLYILADGMGGMENGAAASKYAVEGLRALVAANYDALRNSETIRLSRSLRKTLGNLNAHLRKALGTKTGSTLTFILLRQNRAVFANIGDSPGYLYRDGQLAQITRDHNVAGMLAEMGELTPEEAKVHPLCHQLTSFVGIKGAVTASIKEIEINCGDLLLLCSDGLTGMVPENEISDVLASENELDAAAKKLTEMANDAGGYDNITVLLVRILDL